MWKEYVSQRSRRKNEKTTKVKRKYNKQDDQNMRMKKVKRKYNKQVKSK